MRYVNCTGTTKPLEKMGRRYTPALVTPLKKTARASAGDGKKLHHSDASCRDDSAECFPHIVLYFVSMWKTPLSHVRFKFVHRNVSKPNERFVDLYAFKKPQCISLKKTRVVEMFQTQQLVSELQHGRV